MSAEKKAAEGNEEGEMKTKVQEHFDGLLNQVVHMLRYHPLSGNG